MCGSCTKWCVCPTNLKVAMWFGLKEDLHLCVTVCGGPAVFYCSRDFFIVEALCNLVILKSAIQIVVVIIIIIVQCCI